ncbi:TPA: hypothetical protein ACIC7M_001589 [Escherichia coli]|nr:hypothetical protein [Escherichia coli]MBO9287920.1 hypothetical protein [Escherichia coli]HDN1264748.1 hypothetical protein [Escherichia coli]
MIIKTLTMSARKRN